MRGMAGGRDLPGRVRSRGVREGTSCFLAIAGSCLVLERGNEKVVISSASLLLHVIELLSIANHNYIHVRVVAAGDPYMGSRF